MSWFDPSFYNSCGCDDYTTYLYPKSRCSFIKTFIPIPFRKDVEDEFMIYYSDKTLLQFQSDENTEIDNVLKEVIGNYETKEYPKEMFSFLLEEFIRLNRDVLTAIEYYKTDGDVESIKRIEYCELNNDQKRVYIYKWLEIVAASTDKIITELKVCEKEESEPVLKDKLDWNGNAASFAEEFSKLIDGNQIQYHGKRNVTATVDVLSQMFNIKKGKGSDNNVKSLRAAFAKCLS